LFDAGCGSGLALTLAAKRGATVTGLDAAAGLIAVAADRLPEADLRVGELEELPYPTDSFDVATSFNAVQYAGDTGRALSELARVVRPGGFVAIATWGQPEASEMSSVLAAVGPLMPPPPPGAKHGGPFALSAPGLLESFIEPAGLTPVAVAEVACPMRYPDMDTALVAQASAGVLVLAIRHSGEAAVREALQTSMTPFVQADGSIEIHNTFRYIVGRVS
jgi:SAM-dependent methyltransferase